MHIHEIDLGSVEGSELLAATSSNGPAIEAALKRLDRMFVVTSDWAPGLCFVGGQVSHQRPDSVFSLAGSGEQLDSALASVPVRASKGCPRSKGRAISRGTAA
jgi:hypothetical protein